jgi:hypothetical protein
MFDLVFFSNMRWVRANSADCAEVAPRALGQRRLAVASVNTMVPFCPDDAVPVSWHYGQTPMAAILAFLRKSAGDELVVVARLRVVEDRATA